MRRSALWLLLCAAVVAAWTVFPPPAAWLDRVYGGVVYPAIAGVLVPLTGAFELPVAALVVPSLALAAADVSVDPRTADRVVAPRTAADLPPTVSSDLAPLLVDLRRTSLPARGTIRLRRELHGDEVEQPAETVGVSERPCVRARALADGDD